MQPVTDLAMVWPHVEASLRRFQDHDPNHVSPEFVRWKLDTDQAALYRLTDDGKHLAYFVFERLTGFHTILNIWVCEGSGIVRNFAQIREQVHALAKAKGCESIRAIGRPGWERVAKGFGLPVGTIYEEKVI